MSIFRTTLLALLACAPLLTAAASYDITTAWPVNVGPLNPHLYTPTKCLPKAWYEPLVRVPADGAVKPWLATRWSHSADGKVWLFTLRNDVQFSNGEPFNAQAAVANFRRCWLTGSAMPGWSSPIRLPTCGRSAIRSCRLRSKAPTTLSCRSWLCRARSVLSPFAVC